MREFEDTTDQDRLVAIIAAFKEYDPSDGDEARLIVALERFLKK